MLSIDAPARNVPPLQLRKYAPAKGKRRQDRKVKRMSRQSDWQRKKAAAGLCRQCGRPIDQGARLKPGRDLVRCPLCLAMRRAQYIRVDRAVKA